MTAPESKDQLPAVVEYRGVAYFATRADARAHRDKYAPDGGIVDFLRGYAVQVRKSGPYLDMRGRAR